MGNDFFDIDLSDRHVFDHWTQEGIRWSDTDQLGHVNHLAIGAYVEAGRGAFMMRFGQARQTPLTFVTARLSINYLSELHWPGHVQVGTTLLCVGNSSCTLGHAVFSHAKCVASAISVLVLIDSVSRASMRIPDDVRNGWLDASTRTTLA